MRYGIVRTNGEPKSGNLQRAVLGREKCDSIFEVHEASTSVALSLARFLAEMQDGDEVWVTNLDTFSRNIGDLVILLHALAKRGITVTRVHEATDQVDLIVGPAANILAHLAEHARRNHTPGDGSKRSQRLKLKRNSSRKNWSTHQIAHIQMLSKKGYTAREISLIFREPPKAIRDLLSADENAGTDTAK